MSPMTRPTEIALPAASLAALRTALTAELGEDAAARVLRNAGHEAGDVFFQLLASEADALASVDANAFWRRFAQLFSTRGWGTLSHSDVHPGIALLASSDWAESAGGTEARPSCYFTTGLLANVLGKVAGSDVAVLEVECKARGDAACRFMFGSPTALRGVYDLLLQGTTPDSALSQLA